MNEKYVKQPLVSHADNTSPSLSPESILCLSIVHCCNFSAFY